MILTYAEWLHLVQHPFEPQFPAFLEDYIDKKS